MNGQHETNQAEAIWRKTHPVVVVVILLAFGVLAFLWENPLITVGLLLYLLVWAKRSGALPAITRFFRIIFWLAPFFMLINALFASQGVTYLWKGPTLPVFGRIDITAEELAYAAMGIVRLMILLLLSGMYQRLVNHDRFLFSLARIAPRFVLAAVIAIRLFPFLAKELARIKEVAYLRGIRPQGKRKRDRLRYYVLLLRPLLTTALEGSWITAETLYARGFGSGPRSYYNPRLMQASEKLALVLVASSLFLALFGKVLQFGQVQFYPSFIWYDPVGDGFFFCVLLVSWIMPLLFVVHRREQQ